MTSKERVMLALNRESIDRVPLDFWATPEMKEILKTNFRAIIDEELLLSLNIDLRTVSPIYVGPKIEEKGEMKKNVFGVWEKDGFLGYGENPLKNIKSLREIEAYSWPKPEWFDVSCLPTFCEHYRDFAIRTDSSWGTWWASFQLSQALRGVETFFIDLIDNEEIVNCLLDKITDFTLKVNEKVFESTRNLLDIYFVGDDYGSQGSLLISKELWKKYFKPRIKLLCDQAKSYGLKVMFHSCGAISELIPEMVEVGIDIINPIQTRARGMDLDSLVQFKDLIAFHGGIDTQELLPFGSEKDVRKEVRKAIDKLDGGNGVYILASSQELMKDIPVKNVIAMYDEACNK